MSLANVIPYFRSVMTTLNHQEWRDALADDNIPKTLLDRAFHMRLGEATTIKQNQEVIEITQPIAIQLFVKGYRNTADGRDRAVGYQDAIVKKALETDRRCANATYTGIKNVQFQSTAINELSNDNDNVMKVTLNFNCIVMVANT